MQSTKEKFNTFDNMNNRHLHNTIKKLKIVIRQKIIFILNIINNNKFLTIHQVREGQCYR
jgi:hypothetical protein